VYANTQGAEEGNLKEIVGEFIATIGRTRILPGSVILLGSLSQLARYGTGWYAEDWHKCRKWLKDDLGDVMVLPLVPMPMELVEDESTVRSLLEFLSWFSCLPDVEARLLSETRKHFLDLYLPRIGTGKGWCDGRQSFIMPTSLSGSTFHIFKSRLWGERPKTLGAFSVEQERYWAGKLAANINADFSLDLSVDLCINRQADSIIREQAVVNKLDVVVAGGSNAAKLLAHIVSPEINVTSLAMPGWRLAGGQVAELCKKIEAMKDGTVVVLYGLGNSVFVTVDDDMRSGPPYRGRDGNHHAHGKLEIVSGSLMDRSMGFLKEIIMSCKGKELIVVTPMPRFWLPCCAEFSRLAGTGFDADKARLLKEIGKLRRAILSLIMRLHMSSSVKVLRGYAQSFYLA
jgi:hypothetical protein